MFDRDTPPDRANELVQRIFASDLPDYVISELNFA